MNYPWRKRRFKSGCSGLERAASGKFLRNPPPDFSMQDWAAFACNGITFEELTSGQNCDVRMGCNRLQWEIFLITTPGPIWDVRVSCMGLQEAATGGFLRITQGQGQNGELGVG